MNLLHASDQVPQQPTQSKSRPVVCPCLGVSVVNLILHHEKYFVLGPERRRAARSFLR